VRIPGENEGLTAPHTPRGLAPYSTQLTSVQSLSAVKLAFHGADTDMDSDTDISDAPVVYFCKRVHDSLSYTAHMYTCTRAHP